MSQPGAGSAAGPDPGPLEARLAKLVSGNAASPFAVPGAVLGASGRGGRSAIVALGVDGLGRPVRPDDPFPLTSASKLASGLMLLRLIEEGALALDTPIGAYLPEASAAGTDGVTIRRLLSHTAGLPLELAHDLSVPAGNVRYGPGLRWPGPLAAACLASAPVAKPGTEVRYSNVGYGLLALAAEEVAGEPFARLLDRLVFEPLGIDAYVDRLPDRPAIVVSQVQSPHAGQEIEPINSPTWQLLGTPWAGVSTNVAGLLALARAYAGGGPILGEDMAALARTDQTGGMAGGFPTTEPFLGHLPSRSITWDPAPWGLAIELQGGKEPHWAPSTLPGSFGQIGSSGCLAWCDPASGMAWAVVGAKTTESGWLLRHGARIAEAALASVAQA